jgi:GT2 family glycosyltransferase
MIRASLIIPVHGRAALTTQCLNSLLADRWVREHAEIIVVNDGSTDDTAEALASFGDRIRVITHRPSAGFAVACNGGARSAHGEYLVFLNNDTLPEAGWLEALVDHADRHPKAGIVGCKLLFPDRTIQHAGVVICADRLPRHVYAGFPSDHPAVNKTRPFQAVTGASMLVRREGFDAASGFDCAYVNGYEDIDLCLRLRELGREVHYCHRSVLLHLESMSAGRFDHSRRNTEVFRERWARRLIPDDLQYYVEDGLLKITYGRSYPLVFEVSPSVAVIEHDERDRQASRLLIERARQVGELLKETVTLSADLCDAELRLQARAWAQTTTGSVRSEEWTLHEQLLRHDKDTHDRSRQLQADLGTLMTNAGKSQQSHLPGPLQYQPLIRRLREQVCSATPAGATVIVVSKGDNELVKFESRTGWHFPQTDLGVYAGHHPATSAEAIAGLDRLRAKGGEFLVFPATALWWLDHYREFKKHLDEWAELVSRADNGAVIFRLRKGPAGTFAAAEDAVAAGRRELARQIRELLRSLLPPTAPVLVVAQGHPEFLELEGRQSAPFPPLSEREPDDIAADGRALVGRLKRLREQGFEFLLVPEPAMPWLYARDELRNHLDHSLRTIVRQRHLGWLVGLSVPGNGRDSAA